MTVETGGDVIAVMADPVRLDLWDTLKVTLEPMTIAQMRDLNPGLPPTIHHHLKALASIGLAADHGDGTWSAIDAPIRYDHPPVDDSPRAALMRQWHRLVWARRIGHMRAWMRAARDPGSGDAAIGYDYTAYLTDAHIEELERRLAATITGFRDEVAGSAPGEGRRCFEIVAAAYPLGEILRRSAD